MKSNIIKNIAIFSVIALMITAIALLYFFRTGIYNSSVPNVRTAAFSVTYIGNKRYDITVQNKYIHEKDDVTLYVLLSKSKSTFWYRTNYCYIAEVNILARNGTHSALEIIGGEYKFGDEVIISYDGVLTHGQDIYVVRE